MQIIANSCCKNTQFVCDNVTSIMRRIGKLKFCGHIKDLWCFKCLYVTKHYEVKDVRKFLWNDLSRKELTEEEICFLLEREDAHGQRKDRLFEEVSTRRRVRRKD